MSKVVRSLPARDDLRQIWLYVAQDNLSAADRLIDRFERNLFSLARNPLMGASADHFRPGLRQFTVGNYVLFYELTDDGIRVVRVLHGARKLDDLFD
jgi:toxin ParE1/3/4